MGVGSLVLGIVALLLGMTGFVPVIGVISLLAPVLSVFGCVLGGIGISRAKQEGTGSGIAVAGLVVNIVAFVITLPIALTCGACNACMTGAAFMGPGDGGAWHVYRNDGGVQVWTGTGGPPPSFPGQPGAAPLVPGAPPVAPPVQAPPGAPSPAFPPPPMPGDPSAAPPVQAPPVVPGPGAAPPGQSQGPAPGPTGAVAPPSPGPAGAVGPESPAEGDGSRARGRRARGGLRGRAVGPESPFNATAR